MVQTRTAAPQRPSRQQRAQRGLTLVELLVVMAILSLVLALSMPGVRGPNRSLEMKSLAQDLTSRLRAAHALAIGKGQPLTVDFDLIGRSYAVLAQGRLVQMPADVIIQVRTSRELTQVGGHAQLQFFPDGSATGGQVTLRRAQLSYTIAIDWLTGLVRLETSP